MLQNKIYQNYVTEILKTFLVILFGLSIIALTVRAVNFLELIVESGYPVDIYFKYSFLNFFGIAPKFIPLSFLLALTIFILKHLQDSEFVILWTSGVKKMRIVNLFFSSSLIILIFYLFLSNFLSPLALNKSRMLLSQDKFNSIIPTVRTNQFSDLFLGFTFIVEDKSDNKIQNIFLHDKGGNLNNLTSNTSSTKNTTIMAQSGLVEKNEMFLFNGQIISTKENNKNEIIKFEQLKINLGNLTTSTIKKPKLQETSTLQLMNCFLKDEFENEICKVDLKKEIVPTLNRRIIIALYIPILSLICSLLLIKSKKIYFHSISVFIYSFILLLFVEMAVRFTGLNNLIRWAFFLMPFILLISFYSFLKFKFTNESKLI